MGDDTKARYYQVWQRIIGYIYRIHQMERRPPYQLTARQDRELAGLIHLAQQAEDEVEETDVSDERDDNNDGEEGS